MVERGRRKDRELLVVVVGRELMMGCESFIRTFRQDDTPPFDERRRARVRRAERDRRDAIRADEV